MIARGLSAQGMPSVERNCRITAGRLSDEQSRALQIDGVAPYVASVRFTRIALPTASDAWRSDNWYRPEAWFTLQPDEEFDSADLRRWAEQTVPTLALQRVREDCRRKGVAWPRHYPIVETLAA